MYVMATTDTAHGHTQTEIREITDAEAQALGLASDEAAKLHIDELIALLGTGLDPVQCLADLDVTIERMGSDSGFAEQVKALGARMGAPVPPNRHARRAAKAQARGRK
jgi:hypothetical protein